VDLGQAVAGRLREDGDGRELAGLDVTLRENPDAWASYALDLSRG
jgi:6-pyruvoyltetrahydropterin/6-carboxytetrahydropterin synthase